MELPPATVKTDPKWLAAETVANSRCFQRSSRLRDFLLYVVRYELEGKTGEISEQNIGERVFARRANYSPLDDNIVRVSARQLRVKLKEFYDSEGREEPWVIEIPKGGYVPTFHQRAPAQEETVPEGRPPSELPKPAFRVAWFAIPLALAVILFAVWWGFAVRRSNAGKQAESNLILVIFRKTEDPIQIVLSDSALVAMRNMVDHDFSLEDYSNGTYRQLPSDFHGPPQEVAVWNALANQQIANLGDFGGALHLRDALLTVDKREPIVRSARDMKSRDFRTGSYIVLGGAKANPWVQLLEQNSFNFQFEGQSMVNRNPASGEPRVYVGDNEGHEYARIALVPNLTRTGQALMIAGMSMESTEAAIDYCLSADSIKLLAALKVNGTSDVPSFEALLRTREEAGTGVRAELISVRVSTPRQNP